jgi:predicted patatin/cPLA2 family phospholipase
MKGVFFLINAAVHEKPTAGISFGMTNPVLTRFRIHCFALRAGHSLHRSMLCMVLLIIANMALCSCATLFDRNPVPEQYAQAAKIQGMPFARFWGDEIPVDIEERLSIANKQIKEYHPDEKRQTIDYLALSGGGANGAFGAGLLVGWTAAGDRPEFTTVTGVSTGALIAPFAFLGSQQDAPLKKFYTTTSTKDVITVRPLLKILTGESAVSSEPLRKILIEIFDEKMMAAIAAEYAKGRRLFIGTTNLDADRPVIWNIGAIAASRHPRSAALVADVLLASASIPGVFPPVFIEVEADGKSYDEIHVDGGASSQVFLYPASLDVSQMKKDLGLEGRHRLFLIRNSRLNPQWEAVKPSLAGIAGRSLGTLIRNQGVGDLYRIYLAAQRDGIEYNLAFIPEDFQMESKEQFDPEYMSRLFDLGYRMAQGGYPWKKAPMGFEPP